MSSTYPLGIGRGVAIAIGINAYGSGIAPLANAVADAERLSSVLEKQHLFSQVERLLDADATLNGLRALLQRLHSEVQPSDRLVFYFAGHGYARSCEFHEPPQGYLIPYDGRGEEPATWWSIEELWSQLLRLRCRHLLLILDCCFAGTVRWFAGRHAHVDERWTRDRPTYREIYEDYVRHPGWHILTSTSEDELASDASVMGEGAVERRGRQRNSPFTAALCEALESDCADYTKDGFLTPDELYLFVAQSLRRSTQLRLCPQHPLLIPVYQGSRHKGRLIFPLPAGSDPGRKLSPQPPPSPLERPYLGLRSFTQADERLFFGRARAIRELAALVAVHRITTVVGVSGAGKSSLVHAGLIPWLKGLKSGWIIAGPVRPAADPRAVLCELDGELVTTPSELAPAVTRWAARHPEGRLLLVVDQLEELVTLGIAASEREAFVNSLQELGAKVSSVSIVCTLRLDFESHFSEFVRSLDGSRKRYLIPMPSRDELREMIVGPAREHWLTFEPEALIEDLIDEVLHAPGALPLLSLMLDHLYLAAVRAGEKRRNSRSLLREDYVSFRGLVGILSHVADALHAAIPATEQQTLRWLMLRMVAPRQHARRRVLKSELNFFAGGPEEKSLESVRMALEQGRLITSGGEGAQAYFEPAHDLLVMGWQQLQTWIEELGSSAHGHSFQLYHDVISAAQEWHARAGVEGLLWDRDPRLDAALSWRDQWHAGPALQATYAGPFTSVEREFLHQSQLQRTHLKMRETAKRKRLERALIDARGHVLSQWVDEARRLFVEQSDPQKAAVWLHAVYAQVAKEPRLEKALTAALPYWRRLLGITMKAVEQKRSLLTGHAQRVTWLAWSPDGSQLLSTSFDHTARVWSVSQGRLLHCLTGHRAEVLGGVFSPDGKCIYTASADGTVRSWSRKNGEHIGTIVENAGGIRCVDVSPDGLLLLTAGEDGAARLWNLQEGKEHLCFKGHTDAICSARFSPDGQYVLTGSMDRTLRLWNLKTGKHQKRVVHQDAPVTQLAFHPDGQRAVITVGGLAVRQWDLSAQKPILDLRGHNATVHSAVYSHDGKMVATGSEDHSLRLWSPQSGGELGAPYKHDRAVLHVAMARDNRSVAAACSDGSVHVWESRMAGGARRLCGHEDEVHGVAFSPCGKYVATASHDRTARLWAADSGKLLRVFSGHEDAINRVAFSLDGLRLVTTGWDLLYCWDVKSGELRFGEQLTGGRDVPPWAFSPDGRLLVSGGVFCYCIVDVERGEPLRENSSLEAGIESLAFSPDGRSILAGCSDNAARLWAMETSELLHCLQGHGGKVNCAAFDASGSRILTGSDDRNVCIWDAKSGQLVQMLANLGDYLSHITKVAYSPCGRYILAISKGHAAWLWRSDTYALIGQVMFGGGTSDAVSFTPDGNLLVVAGIQGGPPGVWDTASGKPLFELPSDGYVGDSSSVAVSPDGNRLVAARGSGASIWDIAPETRSPLTVGKRLTRLTPFRIHKESLISVR